MKSLMNGVLRGAIVALAMIAPGPRPAAAGHASLDIELNVFDDSLAPYGDWVETHRHGRVWSPHNVSYGWRPYQIGHWAYTEYGWTWVSAEEFGWATYHYGRWGFDDDYGWVWVPGRTWAPAWVAWRHGGGYVGWAALPPEVGDATSYDYQQFNDPYAYSFVEERYLTDPRSRSHILPVARNSTIVSITANVTNYSVVDNRVVNLGVAVEQIERVVNRSIPRLSVRETSSPRDTWIRGREVPIYRPAVQSAGRPAAPIAPRPAVRRAERISLEQREARDQQRLDQAERSERERLRRVQALEVRRPAARVPVDELRQRHEAEQKTQAAYDARQRQVLRARYEREKRARPPAAAEAPPAAAPGNGRKGRGSKDKGKDKNGDAHPDKDKDKESDKHKGHR